MYGHSFMGIPRYRSLRIAWLREGQPDTAVVIVLIESVYAPLKEGAATFGMVYELLTSHGFRFVGKLDQVDNPKAGILLWADALFVR
jgi:hypothetical protein